MRSCTRILFSLPVALLVAACATAPAPTPSPAPAPTTTTTPSVIDKNELRRLVGTENGVRVDAQIVADELSSGRGIPITYEITNDRAMPVAIAELVPECTYDADTQTVMVAFGSEIPGHEFLPRLLVIPPGQKKSFSARAIVNLPVAPNASAQIQRVPRGLQVKLHFLGDPQPFQQLIGIPEKVVRDPKLADALLPKWLEQTETIITNVLPMRWVSAIMPEEDASRPARRRP